MFAFVPRAGCAASTPALPKATSPVAIWRDSLRIEYGKRSSLSNYIIIDTLAEDGRDPGLNGVIRIQAAKIQPRTESGASISQIRHHPRYFALTFRVQWQQWNSG